MSYRLLIVPVALASACIVPVNEATRETSFDEPVDAVVVRSDSGNVAVRGDDCGCAHLTEHQRWSRGAPTVTAWVDAGTLFVEADCPSAIGVCSVRLDIQVPYDTDVELETGSGGVDVSDIDGVVDAITGSGGMEVRDVFGDVWLEAGSGSIDVYGMEGELIAETGSGGMDLRDVLGRVDLSTGSGGIDGEALALDRIDASTHSGGIDLELIGDLVHADVSTGSGGVDLAVPAGAYRLDVETGSGTIDLDGVWHDPTADRDLRVSTGSGGVDVIGHDF